MGPGRLTTENVRRVIEVEAEPVDRTRCESEVDLQKGACINGRRASNYD